MTDTRKWVRFTPAQRLARFIFYFCAVALFVWSVQTVEVIPEFLYDAPTQVKDLFSRMVPLDFAYYPEGLHTPLMETLHIATLGTLLAIVLALPVGLMGAKNITKVPVLNWFAKLILVSSRTVNSLVWALLFVAVFGPGALAGAVAIGFRSIGFCGKLIAEALEECRQGPVEALKAAGAPWATVFLKGYWPQVAPAFWGILLFRWDINVRESAVIGLVGAGGIGMALETSLNLFEWDRVGVILVCILTIVVLAEIFVTNIRKHII
ncbi:phosphonate ABC transporter, permease protein PhnE [Desulfobaculum bizertense]|uniref:Phosphonate transport system permease protein n=1 Tax=Desulfobaculum bizertense DSM 18034 TaxID=1121442 RepID=A0A1T4VWR3_9BACT|nr:phosphonate ABC transporter, permease protein PhnE [Desulfobaculum bizertense]UIJ36826.1 phosphonate ABC transporter, permease protein PhnE [Desulfobaculum bizertense]SKA69436.1 phosphonate transport system permease protein [Desulfobaculum bizertense DSM 18034]